MSRVNACDVIKTSTDKHLMQLRLDASYPAMPVKARTSSGRDGNLTEISFQELGYGKKKKSKSVAQLYTCLSSIPNELDCGSTCEGG
jgi:hypothetical protein